MFDNFSKADRRQLSQLRIRDAMFDAINELWRQRQSEGTMQKDIGEFLDKDPAWVSRVFSGPSNWTLKTCGDLIEALDGVVFIQAIAAEELKCKSNFNIYAEVDAHCVGMEPVKTRVLSSGENPTIVFSVPQRIATRPFEEAL